MIKRRSLSSIIPKCLPRWSPPPRLAKNNRTIIMNRNLPKQQIKEKTRIFDEEQNNNQFQDQVTVIFSTELTKIK